MVNQGALEPTKMCWWADGRVVDQRAQRDVDAGAVADDRVEQGAARPAVGVVASVVAVDQQLVRALRDSESSPARCRRRA